jgi:LAS superfamily LD-carboxypeptidase LdcB
MSFREGIGNNGQLSKKVLKSIGNGHLLYLPASDSFLRMTKDAQKDGVTIKVNSSYRYCGKKEDYNQRKCSGGFTQWCAWEKYQAGKGNLASNPTKGCKSNHGFGLSIDISPKSAQDWVKKNGTKYGWIWTGKNFSQIEDWHFDYFQDKDTLDKTIDKSKIYSIIGYSTIFLTAISFAYALYYFTRVKK